MHLLCKVHILNLLMILLVMVLTEVISANSFSITHRLNFGHMVTLMMLLIICVVKLELSATLEVMKVMNPIVVGTEKL